MTQPPPPYIPAAPAWTSPVAPAPRKPVGLIAVAIGLAAILVGVMGFAAGRLTAPVAPVATASATTPHASARSASMHPTTNPTSDTPTKQGFVLDGTTLTGWTSAGSPITATIPTGWKIGNYNGGTNSGQLLNSTTDTIDYHTGYNRSALDNCANSMLMLGATEPSASIPGITWAGKAATAVKVNIHSNERDAMIVLTYICVDTTAGHSDLLRLLASPQTNGDVLDAATTLLSTWEWS